MTETLIEVKDIATGKRQIGPKETVPKNVEERRADLEAAIAMGVGISGEALAKVPDAEGWNVSALNSKFGVTLTAEAGPIVARAGEGASFEVSVTFTRKT